MVIAWVSGKPHRIHQLFRTIDDDNSGYIDWEKIQLYLKEIHGEEWIGSDEYQKVRQSYNDFDLDSNGEIDFEEFLHFWLTPEEIIDYKRASCDDYLRAREAQDPIEHVPAQQQVVPQTRVSKKEAPKQGIVDAFRNLCVCGG